MASQRCLYDVLGVETTASIDEIKLAYKRLALKWHPDKIQQSGATQEAREEATTRFQEIGRAYEVLADLAERAWYDSHRSQILSSAAPSHGASGDFDFNLWPYFSPTVFSGYGETEQGFYAVYKEVFQKLHQQEKSFARAYGLRVVVDPPDMGGITTPYLQVSKFYTYWLGFSTVKDFSWCDEFKVTLGPNRKTRRFLEEENKKIRSKARREFNDAVRRLAAFVKKRDKRILERQREVQRLEKEKEHLLKLRQEKMKAEKLLKAKEYEEAEWTRIPTDDLSRNDDCESDIDDSVGSYDWGREAAKNSSRKEKQEEYHCIVCSKKFRSAEQWRNHERSKKHMERVAYLKQSFEEDDAGGQMLAGLSNESCEDTISSVTTHGIESRDILGLHVEDSPELIVSKNSTVDTDNREIQGAVESTLSDVDSEDDEASSLLVMLNSYTERQRNCSFADPCVDVSKSNAQKPMKSGEDRDISAVSDPNANIQLDDFDNQETDVLVGSTCTLGADIIDLVAEDKKLIDLEGQKNKLKTGMPLERTHTADQIEQNQEAPAIDADTDFLKTTPSDHTILRIMVDGSYEEYSGQEVGNKQRFMSRSSIESSHAASPKDKDRPLSKGKMNKGGSKKLRNTCETCGKDFESRNQLFKHIDVANHSILKRK